MEKPPSLASIKWIKKTLPYKIIIEFPYNLAMLFLGIYSNTQNKLIQKYGIWDMETTQMFNYKLIKKYCDIYILEDYTANKRWNNIVFCELAGTG